MSSKYKRYCLSFLFIAILSIDCLFSTTVQAAQNVSTPLKIGFIMVGPVTDMNWSQAHEQGRKFLESTLKNKVQTTVAENVPENAEVERVLEKMIAQGNKLIFTTSFGFFEPALRVAARHPEVIIMQCQRPTPPLVKNVGTYYANQFEPMYVAGVVAGRMTKTGKIGCVAGHPIPQILTCLNAFTLGARSVNPKVKVKVVWTGNWVDPATEAEATKGLIDAGVDVVIPFASVAVIETAERLGAYSIGTQVDMSKIAQKGWLTGQRWIWGPLYVRIVESVQNHTWKPGDERFSMKEGYVDISPFGPAVPEVVRKEANVVRKEIMDGKLVVFKGPLKDRDGIVRIPVGKVADSSFAETTDWLVPGVEGSIPKK